MSAVSLYVAGGSTEAALVASYIRRLAERGFGVTHDWTVDVLKHQAAGLSDAVLGEEIALRDASRDINGVRRSHLLWLIAPAEKSEGAWFEMGAAYGIGLPCVVSGPAASIFRTLATVRFSTHEEAFQWLTTVPPC